MSLIKIAPSGKITNSNIARNVQVGGEAMIDNQGEIESTNIERNLHIPVNQAIEKRWFEKPLGIALISLFVTVAGGGILYYFGWH